MRPADVTTIKIVALPAEHGASVMLGESLLAGLLIAPSGGGFLPALGWVFLFLMSNPLKIVFKDISRRIFTTRTILALWFCGGFGILAAVFFIRTYFLIGYPFLIVLLGAMPLGIAHLWVAVNIGKKEFTAEMLGALSLGAAAASIVLVAGHPLPQALALWIVLAVRAMTSIVYVRERLSQSRGKINNASYVVFIHIVGMAVLGLMVLSHLVKPLVIIGGILLTIRLWPANQRLPIAANVLGLQESILGVAFVVLVVFSF